jgi:N-acetylated-alpha-linked acidic dipeptidase
MRLLFFSLQLAGIIFLSGFTTVAQDHYITGFGQSKMSEQRQLEIDIKDRIQSENFKQHLHRLTRHPHYAGSPESRDVIDYLIKSMGEAGLEIELYDYDVLLADPGEVHIQIEGDPPIPLKNREKVYEEDPYSDHPALTHGWNAYSGSGEVSAEVVYVNYGRKQDFEKLDSLGFDLKGKIAIARYGGNFRGYKARYAEEHGAAGLIIFTDHPGRDALDQVYPKGPMNDPSAIQRGSLITLGYFGDPLTPFEPALPLEDPESPERMSLEEVDLPGIPVAPIGFGAAEEILKRMSGEATAPESWQGGFDFDYLLEGGNDLVVTLKVDQPLEIKRITNVIGKIEGAKYPDEWVILGCHHDAWTFGTADPNSGTAMLLTLSDALGALMEEGWRPARSILFAHWDAEEYGLIGSAEWVEHLLEELQAKTVVYLNADMSVTGSNFRASASPSLKAPIYESAAALNHPDSNITLLDYWAGSGENERPPIGNLGSGSDFAPFVLHAAIPAAHIGTTGRVPVYHSAFDNLHYYENFLDGEYKYGPFLAHYYGILATRFANAEILPYDLESFAEAFMRYLSEVDELSGGEILKGSNLPVLLDLLQNQSWLFGAQLRHLSDHRELYEPPLAEINKALIALERNLLLAEGLEFNSWFRNVFISSDPIRGYAAWTFPALRYGIASGKIENADYKRALIQRHEEVITQMVSDIHEINELLSEL